MKPTQLNYKMNFTQLIRSLSNAVSSLFFADDNREFQRLKNFIAS